MLLVLNGKQIGVFARLAVVAGCAAMMGLGLSLACATAAPGGGGGGGAGNDTGGNGDGDGGTGNGNGGGVDNGNDNGGADNGNNGGGGDNGNNNGGADEMCELGMDNPAATVSYSNDIVPLLERSGCLASLCHGEPVSSNYLQTSYEAAFMQGEEAAAFEICPIVPGDPDASYLVEKIEADPRTGSRMPNNQPPLEQEDIDLIRTWIAEGAPNN